MNAALFTGLCRFSRWRACCRWWLGRLCPWSRNEPPDLANRRFTVLDDRRIVRGDPNREGEREPGNTAARARGGGPGPPHPEAVIAPVFDGSEPFFSASDKVQVKYEMLRAHVVDGIPVAQAAAAHGYSRAAFYRVAAPVLAARRGRTGRLRAAPGGRVGGHAAAGADRDLRCPPRAGGAAHLASSRPGRGVHGGDLWRAPTGVDAVCRSSPGRPGCRLWAAARRAPGSHHRP